MKAGFLDSLIQRSKDMGKVDFKYCMIQQNNVMTNSKIVDYLNHKTKRMKDIPRTVSPNLDKNLSISECPDTAHIEIYCLFILLS